MREKERERERDRDRDRDRETERDREREHCKNIDQTDKLLKVHPSETGSRSKTEKV